MKTMQDTINISLLRHQCGTEIWCKCGEMLDLMNAVQVTVFGTVRIKCASCYDDYRCWTRAMANRLGQKLEIIDGRQISGKLSMTNWAGHARIGNRIKFLIRLGKNGDGRKEIKGHTLQFTRSPDICQIVADQQWTVHRNASRNWTVTHYRTGRKVSGSTSLRGAISIAVSKMKDVDEDRLAKHFNEHAINP